MAYLEKYEPTTWERIGGFSHIKVNALVNGKVGYEDNILAKF